MTRIGPARGLTFEPFVATSPKRSGGNQRGRAGRAQPLRRSRPSCAAATLVLLLFAAVSGEATPSDGDCLDCHDDSTLTREGDGSTVYFDKSVFAASVHGEAELGCIDCHVDVASDDDLPHEPRLQRVVCGECHDDAAETLTKSVHAAPADDTLPRAACVDCHGSHDVRRKDDPESRIYPFRLPQTCGNCHAVDGAAGRASSSAATLALYLDSIHGKALAGGLIVAPTCSSCHGAHDIVGGDDPASRTGRTRIAKTCGTCHVGVEARFLTSIHGEQLAAGNEKAPACNGCHSSHSMRRTDLADWRLDVTRECGNCHEQSLRTFRDTFHGQVTTLGFQRVATCADCHGSHDILPSDREDSHTSTTGRVATCQKCHPSANANFAAYDPHADPHDKERNPELYWVARFMKVLLTSVFTFFGLHSVLWLVRSIIERRRTRARELDV